MRGLLMSAAISLFLATPAEAADRSCVAPENPKTITLADASGQVVQNVLCCCPTYNGGQCCKYVMSCMGGFVPGCFCSAAKPEQAPEKPSQP